MPIDLAARGGGGELRIGHRTRTAQAAPPARRQTWLDALRGLAVLAVLFEHLLDPLFPEVRSGASPWFDFGQYGVMLFFIISGYVVPASLERRGSVTGFWIGRVFRIYPLWLVAAAIGTAFALVPVYAELPAQLGEHPVLAGLAHVTMLQDFLQVVSVVNVFWTLSYEMVFYLLVTAIFVIGARRVRTTGVLAVAVAGVLVGGLLPAGALSRAFGSDVVVLVVTGVMVAGLAAVVAGAHRVRLCGAATVAAMAVVLLVVNSRIGAWQSVAVVATMFAGTALYRLDQGQVRRGVAGWVIGLVPVVSVGAAAWFGPGWSMAHQQAVAFRWSWSTAVAAAWLTFLIGRRLRSSAWPALIVRLGLISYSVYLLHPLLIQVLRRSIPDPVPVPLGWRITWFWVLLAAVVACAVVSHRFIELPGQGMGRRLARSDRLRRLRSVVPGGRTRP